MVTARSYSNSNSGADDIQKTNQKLISHSFEAGKNYSQKEGGTHCGVFLTNCQCLPLACLMPTCSQVDGRVRLPGDQKALKSTQMHGSITSFTPKVNMATPSVLMHIRGNIRGHLLNLWFNVGFKDAQQTDLHFDRTPTDAFFSLVYGLHVFPPPLDVPRHRAWAVLAKCSIQCSKNQDPLMMRHLQLVIICFLCLMHVLHTFARPRISSSSSPNPLTGWRMHHGYG